MDKWTDIASPYVAIETDISWIYKLVRAYEVLGYIQNPDVLGMISLTLWISALILY